VYLASTFDCELDFPINGYAFTPVAFSAVKRSNPRPNSGSFLTPGLRASIRHYLGPFTIPRAARALTSFIDQVQPDIIHALRIPYEGMLASAAIAHTRERPKFIASIWGNDFTLHAPSTPLMGNYTRKTMQAIDALHADCQRDIRLASKWGFDPSKPTLVTPGNGGINTAVFYPTPKPVQEPIIINPRGLRAYVRNDNFFKAAALVLKQHPTAKFLCASMANEAQPRAWVRELNIESAVELLPPMPHARMADVFRRAQIVISPSVHDGTPNSLLEGMACGCFPIAGDLESIREWITPNENGLLFDSNNVESIAKAMIAAIENTSLRAKASEINCGLIATRAEYDANMKQVVGFYEK
jgi:glycosyltransferase involved in cell wall biosynthesis